MNKINWKIGDEVISISPVTGENENLEIVAADINENTVLLIPAENFSVRPTRMLSFHETFLVRERYLSFNQD